MNEYESTAPADLSIILDRLLLDGVDGVWSLLDAMVEEINLDAILEELHRARDGVHHLGGSRSSILDEIDSTLSSIIGADPWTQPSPQTLSLPLPPQNRLSTVIPANASRAMRRARPCHPRSGMNRAGGG